MAYKMSAYLSRGSRALALFTALVFVSASAWAQVQLNACDLDANGGVNSADATLAVNMDIGPTGCTAKIIGINICNVVVVQRVANAANGGACSAGSAHSVTLNWTASVTPSVSYNIYRSTTAGGPYVKIGSVGVGVVTYNDTLSLSGYTYFYVVRAVNSSQVESVDSNEAQAVVSFP
jgi:hypothetical protein